MNRKKIRGKYLFNGYKPESKPAPLSMERRGRNLSLEIEIKKINYKPLTATVAHTQTFFLVKRERNQLQYLLFAFFDLHPEEKHIFIFEKRN